MSGKVILFGYHPLFYTPTGYEPGSFLDVKESNTIQDALNAVPSVKFHGVIWAAENVDSPIYPIIVSDKAKEVADHLKTWSSNNSREWFKFYHLQYTYKGVSAYGLVLHPDTTLSVKRVTLANTFHGRKKVSMDDVTIIYKPIGVFAKTSDAYRAFSKSCQKTTKVYLADSSNVTNMNDLDKLKDLETVDLGEYDVAKPTWCKIKSYCQHHIRKLIQEDSI